jgi:uncharacterized membrane protein
MTLPIFFKILLGIHIIAGSLGLILGTIIVLLKKGNGLHKLLGKIFAYSMLATGCLALILAVIHPNQFLFMVGIFTIALTATGWRYLYLKKIPQGQKPLLLDWVILVSTALFGIVFIIMGVQGLMQQNYFSIIPLIFGWRALAMAYTDYKIYKGKITHNNYWLLFHLQRMMGAYIASLTAFMVVNATNRLNYVAWLLPAIIIVPLIFKWSKKYKEQ